MQVEAERTPIVQCENLIKIYKTKDIEVLALQGLELTIDRGELMAIIGNSGSGKSTFLNMIGGLDRPSAGQLIVDGKDLFKLSGTGGLQAFHGRLCVAEQCAEPIALAERLAERSDAHAL